MTDSNSTALRGALARAVKSHVEMKGLNGVQAAKECGIANSRMSTILRGQVEKISSDALVDILGTLGYRLDSVIGATEGHEFTLTLDEAEGNVLPEIEAPAVITDYLNSDAQDFESYITGEDHIAEVIHSNPHLYGPTHDMSSSVSEEGQASEEALESLSADSDPDADRVIADE